MPGCKGTIEWGKKRGEPCGAYPTKGYEYCLHHIHQRQCSPEEEAEKAAALRIVDRMEAELGTQGIPPGVVAFIMQDMPRIACSPQMAQELSQWEQLAPDELQARLTEWGTRHKDLYDSLRRQPLSKADPAPTSTLAQIRTGTRLQVQPAESLRAPSALAAKDVIVMFHNRRFLEKTTAAIQAQHGDTQLQIDCDPQIGFGPEYAIQRVAQHGPAIAQTFLAMAGYWAKENARRPRDTYLEVYASDLLRYMGRKDQGNGGYSSQEIGAIGSHVSLLKRVSVPKARREVYIRRKRIVETVSIGSLFILDELELQRTLDLEGNELQSTVRFRYHMGSEMFEWLCGEHPQYALASGKLLRYHPDRDKYHILLGFCLTYHDRVNSRQPGQRKISLSGLLRLAGLETPSSHLPDFLKAINRALTELADDGVVPGLTIRFPPDTQGKLSKRQTIEKAEILYPPIGIAGEDARKALASA